MHPDFYVDSICAHPDHTHPFCQRCYNISRFGRTADAVYETSPRQILVLSDSYEQAERYARSISLKWEQFVWLMSAKWLEKFPLCAIHVVKDELYREDLEQISELLIALNRTLVYEE